MKRTPIPPTMVPDPVPSTGSRTLHPHWGPGPRYPIQGSRTMVPPTHRAVAPQGFPHEGPGIPITGNFDQKWTKKSPKRPKKEPEKAGFSPNWAQNALTMPLFHKQNAILAPKNVILPLKMPFLLKVRFCA